MERGGRESGEGGRINNERPSDGDGDFSARALSANGKRNPLRYSVRYQSGYYRARRKFRDIAEFPEEIEAYN